MNNRLPINVAARNAVWRYDHLVPSRFPGGAAIVERTQSPQMPDLLSLPERAEVEVILYGGAITLRLSAHPPRVYIARFEYVTYKDEAQARLNFLQLWRAIENLESPAEVNREAQYWIEEMRRKVKP
jgi:hypothetical protein